ncbi:abortive infection family protein [Frankia gtarii]|uniref:abortive infection family protein n=1 Tax=Frankia gtarii TaxID=2950102 RepID=UPI0021C14E4A|nr:abortive infection family protein [Frankia gtarii]
MSAADLVSRPTRNLFRTLMTGSTYGEIDRAFQDEGFAPSTTCTYEDSSVRRTRTQEYLETVDWTDPSHVTRVLRVFEWLLHGFEAPYTDRFLNSLRRDGYLIDKDTGHITPASPQFTVVSLANLKDPSAIREHLDRIQRAVIDDPALAIGSAKELIESTAKVILTELGRPINEKAKLPALAREAQEALGLHPTSRIPGPDSSDPVRKILGSVSGIVDGLAELRNKGYGTGHGQATARTGLRSRHAHLAVNASLTWCQLILDTLADPEAPRRKTP